MTQDTAPKAAKPKVGKPPAEKKTEAAKLAVKPAAKAAPKADAPKAAKPAVKKDVVNGTVKVTQVIGSIGRHHDQQATLIGLGLNKRNRSRVLEDTPSVRGMIYKVRHLLKVEKAS